MRKISQIALPIVVGLSVVFAGQYFFPPAPKPKPPAGQMSCSFRASANTTPARSASSSIEVSHLDFSGQLTNLSEHDGVYLWSVDGTAKTGVQSRILSGVVFLNPNHTVRGIGLWQDQESQGDGKLRVMTLNDAGILDWNEKTAYVYFESEADKLGHPFQYKCQASVTAAS